MCGASGEGRAGGDVLSKGRLLVACEYSATVRDAFARKGWEAWSCDLLPCERAGETHLPDRHFQCDVRDVIGEQWDMMIAFPPCTDLCVSGARWFKEKQANGQQAQSIDFFMLFAKEHHIPRIAIENPVGIMSTLYRKPDQVIQPWMFGHPEQKSTCLWLKNLPKLTPTNDVKAEMMALPKNKRERLHYLPPSAGRWKERSRTFTGIAQAMADQWSDVEELTLL